MPRKSGSDISGPQPGQVFGMMPTVEPSHVQVPPSSEIRVSNNSTQFSVSSDCFSTPGAPQPGHEAGAIVITAIASSREVTKRIFSCRIGLDMCLLYRRRGRYQTAQPSTALTGSTLGRDSFCDCINPRVRKMLNARYFRILSTHEKSLPCRLEHQRVTA